MLYRNRMLSLLLPSLLGVTVFYIIPFGKTVYYSMIDGPFRKKFVFLDNYISVLNNEYYRLALKNTLVFTVISLCLIMLISFVISLWLSSIRNQIMNEAFLVPLLLPTSAIILMWRIMFGEHSDIGAFLASTDSNFIRNLPIYLIYIWKYSGFNIILITAAFSGIDPCIQEAAMMDGAGSFKRCMHITVPLAMPVMFFSAVLSVVNSFKIFKESFLFYGTAYPPDHAYTLQYYMNNHFFKLNYQTLSAGGIIFAIIVYALVAAAYKAESCFWND